MNLIDHAVDKFFAKYRHKYDRERTKFELENYWSSIVRNISPVTITEHRSGNYITIDKNTFARCIIVGVPPGSENGYPEEMDDGMIMKLIELGARGNRIAYSLKLNHIDSIQARKDIQTSMYITQVNAEETIDKLEKKKHINLQDMDSKIAQEHNESNYRDVRENRHKLFDSSFIITMWANTIQQLDQTESDITLILESSQVKYEIPYFYHLKTYMAAQPFNIPFPESKIRILSPYAAVLASARNPNSKTDQKGMWFGVDKVTNKNIIFDIDKLIAPHLLCVGPTGSGKTASIFAYLMRLLALDYRIIYLTPKADPGTDHRAIVDYYNRHDPKIAELIDIGPGGRNVNPLQIIYDRESMKDNVERYKYAFNMHKEIVIRFFNTWFDNTGSVNMTGILDSTLNRVYKEAGIHRDVPSTWHNANWPVMSDLISIFKKLKTSDSLDADEKKTIKALITKTLPFDTDGMLDYMNSPTTVDFSKQLLVFDMSDIPTSIKPTMNVLITAICGQRFNIDTKKTIIAVDEARVFLSNPELTEFLLMSITMGRSAGKSLWAITQQPSDFTKAGVSEEFQTNTSIKLVFGKKMLPDNIDIVTKYFKFNEYERDHLLNSVVGDIILMIGDQKIPLHIQVTEKELAIVNNKLNTQTQTTEGVFDQKFDPLLKDMILENGFCLDDWQDNVVFDDWQMDRCQDVVSASGQLTTWVRKDMISFDGLVLNQTLDHYASVCQIGAYLLKRGLTNVKINHRDDADITFSTSDQEGAKHEYAIEYEIDGSHSEKQLQDKRARNLEKYGNVYFVCSARYGPKMKRMVGDTHTFTRGSNLKNLLDGIIG